MKKEFLQTRFVRSMVLIRAAVAMAVRQNLAKATTSPERGPGSPLMIVVAILKSRHLRGPITTEIHPLDMATMGRDNSLGTIVATMDSRVIALRIKIIIIQTKGIRIKIETSLVIILITKIDNTITIVCLTQILTSKTIRDITPVEIKIMRDSTRIPYIVSKTMIGI